MMSPRSVPFAVRAGLHIGPDEQASSADEKDSQQ